MDKLTRYAFILQEIPTASLQLKEKTRRSKHHRGKVREKRRESSAALNK